MTMKKLLSCALLLIGFSFFEARANPAVCKPSDSQYVAASRKLGEFYKQVRDLAQQLKAIRDAETYGESVDLMSRVTAMRTELSYMRDICRLHSIIANSRLIAESERRMANQILGINIDSFLEGVDSDIKSHNGALALAKHPAYSRKIQEYLDHLADVRAMVARQ
jgi:hypothetical protein